MTSINTDDAITALVVGVATFCITARMLSVGWDMDDSTSQSIADARVRKALRKAALSGDAQRVRALIATHQINPSSHRDIGPELLHAVASLEATTPAQDKDLMAVLDQLFESGWTPTYSLLVDMDKHQTWPHAYRLQLVCSKFDEACCCRLTRPILSVSHACPRVLGAYHSCCDVRLRGALMPPGAAPEHRGEVFSHACDCAWGRGRAAVTFGAVQVVELVWHSAMEGDADGVKMLLTRHGIPPNAGHPSTGACLVAALVAVNAASNAQDHRLSRVLQELLHAGWRLTLSGPELMLRTLAQQPEEMHIARRATVLLLASLVEPLWPETDTAPANGGLALGYVCRGSRLGELLRCAQAAVERSASFTRGAEAFAPADRNAAVLRMLGLLLDV